VEAAAFRKALGIRGPDDFATEGPRAFDLLIGHIGTPEAGYCADGYRFGLLAFSLEFMLPELSKLKNTISQQCSSRKGTGENRDLRSHRRQ
jgi:hypothetical protein